MKFKVSIIGAGNVGASTAFCLVFKNLADIVLVDILPGRAAGKSLDLLQLTPILNLETKIVGSDKFEDTARSDILIIAAGVPRKEGMSREELLLTNAGIVKEVVRKAAPLSPEAVIIVATNPLDAMSWLAYRISGFDRRKVIGMGGLLDSARFRLFIAQKLKVGLNQVQALVIGPHGEGMIPLPRLAMVNGQPLYQLLPEEEIDQLVERVVGAGAEIISLTGLSAQYAPGAALTYMTEAILKGSREVIPCSVCLEGKYGLRDLFLGVPIRLGREGVKEIIELELNKVESGLLKQGAEKVQTQITRLKESLNYLAFSKDNEPFS